MHKTQNTHMFASMSQSIFSFQALTRLWLARADDIPDAIMDDLTAVQKYIMDPYKGVSDEVVFTGSVDIYRGAVKSHPDTGRDMLPVTLVGMDEYGYSKKFNTTFHLYAQTENPSVGFTHQLADNLDVPAEARLALNLEITAIHGDLAGLVTAERCTTKGVNARVGSFPFADSRTVFRHVGDKALEIGTPGNPPIAYLAYGIMTPTAELSSPDIQIAGVDPVSDFALPTDFADFLLLRSDI